jgi:hypothetical protein
MKRPYKAEVEGSTPSASTTNVQPRGRVPAEDSLRKRQQIKHKVRTVPLTFHWDIANSPSRRLADRGSATTMPAVRCPGVVAGGVKEKRL